MPNLVSCLAYKYMNQTPRSNSVSKKSSPGEVSLAIVEDDVSYMGESTWGDGFYDFERSVRVMSSSARGQDFEGEFEDGFFKLKRLPAFR